MKNRQGSSGQGQRDRNDSTGVIGKQHGGIRAFQIQTLADIYKADVLPVSRSGWVGVKFIHQLPGESASIVVYGQDHPVLPYAGPDFDDQGLIGF